MQIELVDPKHDMEFTWTLSNETKSIRHYTREGRKIQYYNFWTDIYDKHIRLEIL